MTAPPAYEHDHAALPAYTQGDFKLVPEYKKQQQPSKHAQQPSSKANSKESSSKSPRLSGWSLWTPNLRPSAWSLKSVWGAAITNSQDRDQATNAWGSLSERDTNVWGPVIARDNERRAAARAGGRHESFANVWGNAIGPLGRDANERKI